MTTERKFMTVLYTRRYQDKDYDPTCCFEDVKETDGYDNIVIFSDLRIIYSGISKPRIDLKKFKDFPYFFAFYDSWGEFMYYCLSRNVLTDEQRSFIVNKVNGGETLFGIEGFTCGTSFVMTKDGITDIQRPETPVYTFCSIKPPTDCTELKVNETRKKYDVVDLTEMIKKYDAFDVFHFCGADHDEQTKGNITEPVWDDETGGGCWIHYDKLIFVWEEQK